MFKKNSYSPARKKQLARPSHAWATNVNNQEAPKETLLTKAFTSYYEWVQREFSKCQQLKHHRILILEKTLFGVTLWKKPF